MPRRIALIDEVATRQDQQVQALPEFYIELDSNDDDDETEPGYGSDPFDIVAHREEQGLLDNH